MNIYIVNEVTNERAECHSDEEFVETLVRLTREAYINNLMGRGITREDAEGITDNDHYYETDKFCEKFIANNEETGSYLGYEVWNHECYSLPNIVYSEKSKQLYYEIELNGVAVYDGDENDGYLRGDHAPSAWQKEALNNLALQGEREMERIYNMAAEEAEDEDEVCERVLRENADIVRTEAEESA